MCELVKWLQNLCLLYHIYNKTCVCVLLNQVNQLKNRQLSPFPFLGEETQEKIRE